MLTTTSSFALFDNNLDASGDLLLTDLVACLRCEDAASVASVLEQIELARREGRWVALAIRYELGYALEPRLRPLLRDGTPLLTAWIYRQCERLAPQETARRISDALAQLDEHSRLAGVAQVTTSVERDDYLDAVSRIQQFIAAGDCYQVNFTFAMKARAYGNSLAVYDALRSAQPVRYGALIAGPEGAILSRSPELFVERTGQELTCRPMKGTAPRESNPHELATSEKNRAENVMIVDLIRNDLGRLAPAGGVRVERLFEVEPYPRVWQMTSTVSASPVSASFQEILAALFPCGSITGAPKLRAMEIIRELEPETRGIYCGALGWLAPSGDFRLSVPIRTLELDQQGEVRLGLGSGIVADSDPAAEWAECLLKGRFVTELKPHFGLIETLRCEPEMPDPYPHLDRHLARLERSARELRFVFDRKSVTRKLKQTASKLDGTHRVRLELAPDGSTRVDAVPLEPLPWDFIPTVIISQERVRSSDLLQRHKTTARELYDRELRRATAAGHFDILFLNERGELAEGARTTLFVDRGDGHMLTPPLECGALDGVYRRKLLDEGLAAEQRLTLPDIAAAEVIHLSNALRGLIPARLVISE